MKMNRYVVSWGDGCSQSFWYNDGNFYEAKEKAWKLLSSLHYKATLVLVKREIIHEASN